MAHGSSLFSGHFPDPVISSEPYTSPTLPTLPTRPIPPLPPRISGGGGDQIDFDFGPDDRPPGWEDYDFPGRYDMQGNFIGDAKQAYGSLVSDWLSGRVDRAVANPVGTVADMFIGSALKGIAGPLYAAWGLLGGPTIGGFFGPELKGGPLSPAEQLAILGTTAPDVTYPYSTFKADVEAEEAMGHDWGGYGSVGEGPGAEAVEAQEAAEMADEEDPTFNTGGLVTADRGPWPPSNVRRGLGSLADTPWGDLARMDLSRLGRRW